MGGQVNTVLGSVLASQLGVASPHEHLLISLGNWYMQGQSATSLSMSTEPVGMDNLWRVRRNPYSYKDNLLLGDIERQLSEVELFKRAGGNTLVDLTLREIGRDPAGLAEISRAAGLHVIAGTGLYVHTAHPADMDSLSVEDIAQLLVRDLTEGIDNTDVKAGVIGEVGTWDPIQPNEEKSLRGAAAAHRRTGAPIIVHTYLFAKWGLRVLDILEEEGVSPDRVALAHVDSVLDLEYHRMIADRGAYVEYDLFGAETTNDDWRRFDRGTRFIPPIPCDMERILAAKELISSGYGERLLFAQDICMKVQLTSYGGYGYGHILRDVVPLMRDLDIPNDAIQQVLSGNPQRLLGWSDPVE